MIESKASTGSMVDVLELEVEKMKATETEEWRGPRTEESRENSCENCREHVNAQARPFFLDWLDRLDPEALRFATRFLPTPDRKRDNESGQKLKPTPERLSKVLWPLTNSGTLENRVQNKGTKQEITQSIFHKQSVMIGNGWNAKGLEKARLGKWKDALACWENSMEIRRQIHGDNHLDVANTFNNVGTALGKLGQHKQALDAMKKALAIRIDIHGYEHSEVAATYHNLGNLHQQNGEFQDAMDNFATSKAILERTLGKHTVQVARTTVAIGHNYFATANYGEARDVYCQALKIFYNCGLSESNIEVQQCQLDIDETEELAKL